MYTITFVTGIFMTKYFFAISFNSKNSHGREVTSALYSRKAQKFSSDVFAVDNARNDMRRRRPSFL